MIAGRVWKFGDDINTDLMLPRPTLYLPRRRSRRALSSRPTGRAGSMRSGPATSSSAGAITAWGRAGRRRVSMRNVGIACLIADCDNGVFFRNCVNFGMLTLQCPGVHAAFAEGQTAEVSIDEFHGPQPRDRVVLRPSAFRKTSSR